MASREKATKPKNYIQREAIRLLSLVVYYEDRTKRTSQKENKVSPLSVNSRSVGLSYVKVVKAIKEKYPEAKTTTACLRWYAAKIREGKGSFFGNTLPEHRPRT